jgi:hypothetical protein
MHDRKVFQRIIGELIEALHLQARELATLVEHVEQVAGHLGYQHQFSLIASELSELQVRLKKLGRPTKRASEGEAWLPPRNGDRTADPE